MKSNNQLDQNVFTKQFERDGYVVVRSLASDTACSKLLQVVEEHHKKHLAPVEYEVDVQYPGAPKSPEDPGGKTIRRLLHAYARDPVFRDWATGELVKSRLQQLFSGGEINLSQSHHNCIMTKEPGYSSATLWHQDNRYWSFDEQNLISVWLAMGEERDENGCLWVIPGSHKMDLVPGRYDAASFLRTDLKLNQTLISQAIKVELDRGDVVFFHSQLFHAAGRNQTQQTKKSLVFTYHDACNNAIENTRSSQFPSIKV